MAMTADDKQKLREEAKKELREEAKKESVEVASPRTFIKEAIRWGIRIDDAIKAASTATSYAHAKAIRAADSTLDPEGVPTWAEISRVTLSTSLPKVWGAEDVVVTEATVDPVRAAVTRSRKWSEAHAVVERDGRHFVACSDGVNYFPTSQVEEIEALASVIAIVAPEDIPAVEE